MITHQGRVAGRNVQSYTDSAGTVCLDMNYPEIPRVFEFTRGDAQTIAALLLAAAGEVQL